MAGDRSTPIVRPQGAIEKYVLNDVRNKDELNGKRYIIGFIDSSRLYRDQFYQVSKMNKLVTVLPGF